MVKYYKTQELTIENLKTYKGTSCSFMQNGLIKKISILDIIPNSLQRQIVITYHVDTINPFDNSVLITELKETTSLEYYYNLWYDIVSPIGIGYLIYRASLNTVLEKELGEGAVFYNPLQDYFEFQPVFYDLEIVDNNCTVSNVLYAEGKTVQYSLDGINYKTSNEFLDLDNGTYKMYVKTVEDEYPTVTDFTIEYEIITI
jgi:hypothetical protein